MRSVRDGGSEGDAMTGTHTAAACLVERGQVIETRDGVAGEVARRYNSRKRNGLIGWTFLYLTDGRRLVLAQTERVTITKEANE